MKATRLGILALAACLTLAGCRGGTPEVSPAPSGPSGQAGYTRQDAYDAFQAWNQDQGVTGRTATGCVLAEDGYAGLRAVLTYTDEGDNTECNLAYLYEDGGCALLGVVSNRSEGTRDFVLAEGPAYLGEGRVSLVTREVASGSRYRYTVQCGPEGADDQFTVETEALGAEESPTRAAKRMEICKIAGLHPF